MIMNRLTQQNIFLWNERLFGDNDGYLVYLPLVDYVVRCNSEEIQELQSTVNGTIEPLSDKIRSIMNNLKGEYRKVYRKANNSSDLSNLMILPNSICNFNCSYCYSASGRSDVEINLDKLKCGLRWFISSERLAGKLVTISVLGGGEPLLSWHILKPALEYAFQLNRQLNVTLPVSLVTNGSIISEDIKQFCLQNRISLSVSFDILEDVQNCQRGAYSIVLRNIKAFADCGIDLAINSVITKDNVWRMNEMIESMVQELPKVKKVSFKPIISNRYFSSVEERQEYYKAFVDNFFIAQEMAEKSGIWLTSPYSNVSMCISDRYCPGKFVITPTGTISVCHCVSSPKDANYEKFIYGKINESKDIVEIDENRLSNILSYDMYYNERCVDCPAKFHCAGGCYADACLMTEQEHSAYCESMRYFLYKYLRKKHNI